MSQFPKVISYDLTTPKGMAEAVASYMKENQAKAAIGMTALAALNPFTAIGYGVYKLSSALLEKTENRVDERSNVIDEQRKAAVDIIKAGKGSGASKVRVTLNQKAGIDIGGALEGYSLKFSVGTDDQMIIEAEYK